MSLQLYDNGHTTFCPDTPENWTHFHDLLARLNGSPLSGMAAQIASENARIKEWSSNYLPLPTKHFRR